MIVEVVGVGGAGKSTLIARLRRRLTSNGHAVAIREARSVARPILAPAMRHAAEEHRLVLWSDVLPLCLAVERVSFAFGSVQSAASCGSVVLTDTYLLLWIAESMPSRYSDVCVEVLQRVPPPDVSVWLAPDVSVAHARLLERELGDDGVVGGLSGMRSFQERLAHASRIVPYDPHCIDTGVTPSEEVEDQVFAIVSARLGV